MANYLLNLLPPTLNPKFDKKFEIMLTRRTKAYSSSGSVV